MWLLSGGPRAVSKKRIRNKPVALEACPGLRADLQGSFHTSLHTRSCNQFLPQATTHRASDKRSQLHPGQALSSQLHHQPFKLPFLLAPHSGPSSPQWKWPPDKLPGSSGPPRSAHTPVSPPPSQQHKQSFSDEETSPPHPDAMPPNPRSSVSPRTPRRPDHHLHTSAIGRLCL